MWDVNRDALAAHHRLVLWEPPGHARSDSPEDPARYSFARWALDLKAVLDHLRLRTAHVGGLSLGAGIATRFTLAFPARVRSLLVTNSSSAAGLPLSVDNIVMRARSIEVTLTRAWTRWQSSRWRRIPTWRRAWRSTHRPRTSSTPITAGSRRSPMPTRCARCWRWTTSPSAWRRSACPCC